MKHIIFSLLMICSLAFLGCNSEEDSAIYTQSELETFLIRDSQEAIYVFDEGNIIYEFDFKKTSEGYTGKYYRLNHSTGRSRYSNFIWGLKPSGDGAIVSITFEDKKTRIELRMGLMDQEFTIYDSGSQFIEHGTKKLWKLYFTLQDDPFKE